MQANTEFLLVVPPGFEKVAYDELITRAQQLGYPKDTLSIERIKGGLVLNGDPRMVATISHHLKVPTRILNRLATFPAKNIGEFNNGIKAIPFHRYLFKTIFDFKISCRQSKLMHTGKIEDAIRRYLENLILEHPISKKIGAKAATLDYPIEFFIRLVDNICTISIDFTGPQLLKRKRGEPFRAPIRENLAAASALKVLSYLSEFKVTEKLTLIDPFCGSGTLLKEARTLSIGNSELFSYQCMPLFSSITPKILKEDATFAKIIGSDRDPQAIETASQLLTEYGIELSQKDLFETTASTNSNVVIFSNLPYGKRVPIPRGFYKDVMAKLIDVYSPTLIALIAPVDANFGRKATQTVNFENGGLKVSLHLFML